MTASPFTIDVGDVPPDDIKPDFGPAPKGDIDNPANPDNWFDPEYPYSTEEHKYGYFTGSDGLPDYTRPRKRRPHGKRSGSSPVGNTMASDKQARLAASLLARFNALIGVGLAVYLPQTAREMGRANAEFEEMAYAALLNDPELCRRIMAAGTTSGRAQLAMAYALFGGALAPLAYSELKDKRNNVVKGERVA